ncbi:hypothetical protein F4801DRAFT_51891 [Xylaria longipes]|nr:hypothetical protein F4801DRAFT_51891 [Xylaria longipes]RYC65062.1 hypothetical protein CHU98_g1154 [Xylaria longipes]
MLSSPNLPFVIGNDICRVARVRRILKGRLGPQFVRRILRTEEIQHSTTARILRCILDQNAQGSQDAQPVPKRVAGAHPASTRDAPSFTRAVEFMAGRFAAKEAVIKAHPHRRLTFQCIAILRTANSPEGPVLDTSGQGREPTIDREGGGELEPRPNDDETSQSGPLVALIKAEEEEEEGAQRDTYASVSISHDTDYATAVCLGINPTSRLIWGSMQNT